MGDKENGTKKGLAVVVEELQERTKVLKEKVKEEVENLKKPEKTQLYKSMFRVKHDDTRARRAPSASSPMFSSTSIRPKSTATPRATATLGEWAGLRSTCSSC